MNHQNLRGKCVCPKLRGVVFSSWPKPLFQSEAKFEAIDAKMISLISCK